MTRAAAAWKADGQGTPVSGEAVGLDIDGIRLRLWRAVDLAQFVDAEALLRADVPAEPPYWMYLWPGAMAAARLIASAAEVGPGRRVLELGCGLALPALVAARRGAAAVATDRQHAPLAFARRSATLNDCALAVVQMDWGTPALRGAFDVCVGADIGYDASAEAALVATLAASVAPHGVVWLADSVNTARGGLAARLSAAGFAVEVRQIREWEDGRAVWVRVLAARRAA
jgi:predicted nicotinamide N-methyase